MTALRAGRLCALALGLFLWVPAARGDGGLLRLTESAGPFDISVFTAPTPLRVGAADVSVMVLERAGRAPVLDADVQVTLHRRELERASIATHDAATNKLLYAAWLDVPEPGKWSLDVRVQSPAGTGVVSCGLDVAAPLSPLEAFWPYIVFPAVAIGLFAVHQRLKRQ